jgi:hypothetical protein
MIRRAIVAGVLVLTAGADCRTRDDEPPSATKATPTAKSSIAAADEHVRIVPAEAQGDVAALVRTELARARESGRHLIVYVGATWCEPCRRFHEAAARGELDSTFPTLTLLEFDLDRDEKRLAAASYSSELIPLFAIPASDGRASSERVEGGIKGDGAVGFIVPRLRAMLARTVHSVNSPN